MDFFSKLGDTLSSTGKDVTNKAREITEVTRLNLEIRGREEVIRRHYEEIGRKYYELHKDDEGPMMEEMAAIKEAFSVIKRKQADISQLRGLKICPVCSEGMELHALFCTKCGQRWEEIYEEE